MYLGLKLVFLLSFFAVTVEAQILANYAPITISAGRDTSVTPATPPVNTSRIAVFASGNFSGILTANSSTGKVSITDAKPVGAYTISVMAFSSSGSSTVKTFTLIVNNTECNDGRFNGNTNYPIIRNNLTGLAIGDFNGDDKQDLLAAHIGHNTVSIRLGNGAGGFTGNTEEVVSSHPYAVAVGDFNRDGKQDFIVSNEGADLVAVRLGDGTGAFSSMPNVHVGNAPAILAIGDFNNDAKQDFVVANFHSNTVSVCLGDGLGNFSVHANVPVGTYPECVVIADFNNDGKQDFVVSNSGAQSVSVRLGNGLGGFTVMPDVTVGYNPYSVVSGDFNSDGILDLAVANYASGSVSVRFGDGTGAFTGSTDFPVSGGPYSVTIGNFNGDEHLDLAITNYFTNKVSIKLGDGLGAFYGNTTVAVGSYPVCVVSGDFNGDRRQDIAVANYNDHSISVRLGMNGIPSASPLASNSPVCEGGTIELFATGGSSYSWSGPNGFSSNMQTPVIPGAMASHMGIYSLSLMDNNNCSATLSTLVRVNPPPLVSFVLAQDSLCSFDPALVISGGMPLGGVYSGPGVVSGNIFDPATTGPGNFYLHYTYTDTNDCSNSQFDKMNVVICAGTEEISVLDSISVYPNPVKNELTIDLNTIHGTVSIELFSQQGSLLKVWQGKGGTVNSFPTSDLCQGLYFLRLMVQQEMKLFKINVCD